jgi:hypothetical protein
MIMTAPRRRAESLASGDARSSSERRGSERPDNGERGDPMGKEARIGLLLGATACLLAVMVDWVVEELHEDEHRRS